MNIKGVVTGIKKNGLIPYVKSKYRKKRNNYFNKKYSNSGILLINLNDSAQKNNKLIKKSKDGFVAFYDTDAAYDEEYFDKLRDYLIRNKGSGFATGEIVSKSGIKLAHFKTGGNEPYFYDVSKKVEGAPLLIGSLYRMKHIKKNRLLFDNRLKYCKAELFATKYHEMAPKGILVRELSYKTGRALDEMSPNVGQSHVKEWYFDTTRGYLNSLIKDNKLSKIAQFGFLYLTSLRFLANKNGKIKNVFDSGEEQEDYLNEVGSGMRLVEDNILFGIATAIKMDRNLRRYFAMLRNKDRKIELEYKKINNSGVIKLKGSTGIIRKIEEIKSSVNTLDYIKENGKYGFFIKFTIPDYMPEEKNYKFDFILKIGDKITEYTAKKTTELAAITTFFNEEIFKREAYEVFIPFDSNSGEISLRLAIFEDTYKMKIFFSRVWQSRMEDNNEYNYWYIKNYIVKVKDGELKIQEASEDDRKKAEEKYLKYIESLIPKAKDDAEKADIELALKWRRAYWERRNEFKNKRIWIYYDKVYKAGDNGEHAFKYACKQNDGIEKVFYIDKTCKSGQRLEREGYKVLEPGTLEGALYALNSEIIFMTHVPPFFKLGLNDRILGFLKDLLKAKIIRMYHGFPITRSSSYTQMSNNIAAVVVASKYEKELYQNEDNCFKPSQIIESGNPRYDGLIDEGYKQILIAPTWRPHLTGKSLVGGETLYNNKFKESDYYKLYNKILKNKKLLKKAREKGYKIKMFLHPKLAVQTVDFASNDIVEALSSTEEMDYVTIMKQSAIMVTDYSSVQFDFAYMRKPVVYYQDTALPYWRVVNFDYEKIGFGEVCKDTDSLINILCGYLDRDCKIEDIYRERINDFFIQNDHNASKLVYEAARKLAEEE